MVISSARPSSDFVDVYRLCLSPNATMTLDSKRTLRIIISCLVTPFLVVGMDFNLHVWLYIQILVLNYSDIKLYIYILIFNFILIIYIYIHRHTYMSKWHLFVFKITSPFVCQKGGDDRRHTARESQFPKPQQIQSATVRARSLSSWCCLKDVFGCFIPKIRKNDPYSLEMLFVWFCRWLFFKSLICMCELGCETQYYPP